MQLPCGAGNKRAAEKLSVTAGPLRHSAESNGLLARVAELELEVKKNLQQRDMDAHELGRLRSEYVLLFQHAQ